MPALLATVCSETLCDSRRCIGSCRGLKHASAQVPAGASDGEVLEALRAVTLPLPRATAAAVLRAAQAPPPAAPESLQASGGGAGRGPASGSRAGASAASSSAGGAGVGVSEAGGTAAGSAHAPASPRAAHEAQAGSDERQGGPDAGARASVSNVAGRNKNGEPGPLAQEDRQRQYAAMAAQPPEGQPGDRQAPRGTTDPSDRVAAALSAAARPHPDEDPVERLRARMAANREAYLKPSSDPDPQRHSEPLPNTTARVWYPSTAAGGTAAASQPGFANWREGAASGATLADVAASLDGGESSIYSRRRKPGRAPAAPGTAGSGSGIGLSPRVEAAAAAPSGAGARP